MDTGFDQAPCYAFSCKEDGTLLQVNDTLCDRLGYDRQGLVGKKAELIFTVATRIFQQTHFGPLLQMHGHAEEIFISLQTKAGEAVPILVNASRKEADHVTTLLYVGIEVKNRKRFEEELIAARNAAETALRDNTELTRIRQELENHVEQLDYQIRTTGRQNHELFQFNKVITHDLQEPLRKLSVFANMILKPEGQLPQEAIIEKLNGALAQMRLTISGLQKYVWLTERPIHLAELDLTEIIQVVRERLSDEHPSMNLVLDLDAQDSVLADEAQLEVLLYQLLSNAIRFKKEDGETRVKISAQRLVLNKYRGVEGKYKYTNYTKIEIADSGVGFDNKYADKAFELFRRLHASSGRGIGLALSKKIVEAHHGTISISSAEGVGTTVSILLLQNNRRTILRMQN